MIVIVDYGMGNLGSVQKAVDFLGRDSRFSDSVADIKNAEKLILPGVGHFGETVKELQRRKLFGVIQDRVKQGVPFLGICVGMQLLLNGSEEAEGMEGLGVISGEVRRFAGDELIVPHMGWNQVVRKASDASARLFDEIPENSYFYFAHSYYCDVEDTSAILSTTEYGGEFVSSIHKDNIWAIQFHPEKSQRLGLKLLENFFASC